MEWGSWHCTGDRDQDHPHGKEMQKSKMAVSGSLTNSCEKKRSKKPRRKGHRVYKNIMYLPGNFSLSFSSVQSLSRVHLFATPWIAARQASLSITNSHSSSKLLSIELVMSSSHLILCHPLLCLPPVLPSIRVFSNESILLMRWPKYWSFSLSFKRTPRADLL